MARGQDTGAHPNRQVGRERYPQPPVRSGDIDSEMARRAELEDEYGGGAGDWDDH